MLVPSIETLKRAALRALWVALLSAMASWALLPINLDNPKLYLIASLLALVIGFLEGLRKFITGYIKYDK